MELGILRNLKKGAYIEFNTTGKDWDDSSLFLAEEVFSVFSDCFSLSHPAFDRFGRTLFKRPELEKLDRELGRFQSRLDFIVDLESFEEAISTLSAGPYFLGELESEKIDWKTRWLEIAGNLKGDCLGLTRLVAECLQQNTDLWLLGI